jgi:hypothetical protein
LNAMSSNWEVFFNLAVADWDYGNPDALSLNTETIEEDKDCKPINGAESERMTTSWRLSFLPQLNVVSLGFRQNQSLQWRLR